MSLVRVGWMWTVIGVGMVTAWSLSPGAALAQTDAGADAEARAHFEAGRLAFSRGRYEQALDQFQEAYELSGRSALLYNIGTTLDRLRRDEEAIAAFEAFLEAEPESDYAPEVQERVRILRETQSANAHPDVSPEAVAAASTSDAPPPETPPAEDDRIVRKWWFWTILGVVVVGATVGIAVGASGGGTQGPLRYDANTVTVEL